MKLKSKKYSFKTALKFRLYKLVKYLLKIGYKETYSGIGEDFAINHLFKYYLSVSNGFYIDVGCNHPIKDSNTYLLYRKGWKGITIDLNDKLIELHKKERKEDIQIHSAISNEKSEVKLYEFKSDSLSTIDKNFYEKMISENEELISNNKLIKTRTLNDIVEEFNVLNIDLLCIDVEGHDFQVLKSLDLKKYRPKLIVIEMLTSLDFDNLQDSPIYSYLKENNYKLIGYLVVNGYFMDNNL